MSGDHNMYQKDKSYLDFECPRCGHCCKTDLARVGEVGVWDDDEPVAWRSTSPEGKLSNKFACKPTESNWVEPLYAAPPKRELTCVCGAVWEGETMVHPPREREWVGLTEEEIAELHYEIKVRFLGTYKTEDIYRAIEKRLKEKNT